MAALLILGSLTAAANHPMDELAGLSSACGANNSKLHTEAMKMHKENKITSSQ